MKTNWRFGVYEKTEFGSPVSNEKWLPDGKYGLCVFATEDADEPIAFNALLFKTLDEAITECEDSNLAHDNGYINPEYYKHTQRGCARLPK